MDDYLQANQRRWDRLAGAHAQSPFYDLEGFKAGKESLRAIEVAEVGDVTGKTMLHLQCHFGLDTLSWARRGAMATGVDFSGEAIALAKSLSEELQIPAQFYQSDISSLPDALVAEFDIVFTSYGVLHGLPELQRWAEVIVHFLKPNGIFYIVEDHPFFRVFRPDAHGELRPVRSYFHSQVPQRIEASGSYAAAETGETEVYYVWDHSLGDVINSLIAAGLTVEFVHEFPYAARAKFPSMEQGEDGWWRLPSAMQGTIPFLFSLQARKVA